MDDFSASFPTSLAMIAAFASHWLNMAVPNDANIEVCDPSIARLLKWSSAKTISLMVTWTGWLRACNHGQVCYAANPTLSKVSGTITGSVSFEDANNQVGRLRPDGTLDLDLSRWQLWVNNRLEENQICAACPVYPICQGKYCPRSSIRENKPVCPMTRTTYAQLVQLAASGAARFQ